jgi:hypothetical protein
MNRLIIGCLLFVLLCGCTSKRIEQKIRDRIEAQCKNGGDCIIRIKDITDFGWDKMFVFDYGVSQEQIEKALGTPFPGYVEFTRRLVFLKTGKIIYSEDEPTDIEAPVNGMVSFGIDKADGYKVYTPDEAVFRAERNKFSKGIFYHLKPTH